MYKLLYTFYEFAAQFLPFLVVQLIWKHKQGDISATGKETCLLGMFVLYVMAVFSVTGAGTLYEALNGGTQCFLYELNLIPFSRDISVVGYTLNVILFLPFGFFAPMLWKSMGKFPRILLGGFLFSLLIELSQILNWRGTDVDDLIMNTLGAAIGYLGYLLWRKLRKGKEWNPGNVAPLPICILAIYFGRCLLLNTRLLLR